jgi:hypothetical protein
MDEKELSKLQLAEVDEDEDEDEDYEDEDDEDEVSLADLFQTFFGGDNNKNVVDTIAMFHKTMETQNKILMKIANSLENLKNK